MSGDQAEVDMLVPPLLLLALTTVTCQSHDAKPIYRGVAVLNGGPVRGRVEFIKEVSGLMARLGV